MSFLFFSFLSFVLLLLLFSRLQQCSAPPPGHALLFSSLLLFSPLSSSSSSLAYSSVALFLQATLPPCWELENGRACSTHVGDQISLNQERDTQRRKTVFFFFSFKFIVFEKSPMKSVAGRPHYCNTFPP